MSDIIVIHGKVCVLKGTLTEKVIETEKRKAKLEGYRMAILEMSEKICEMDAIDPE